MRKFNTDRMRRNVARSTPDYIERRFNMTDKDEDLKYYDWLKKYSNKMTIKHHGGVTLDVISDEMAGYWPGQVLIKVKVRKEI